MRQLEKLKHYIFDNIKKLLLIFFGYVNYVVMFKRFSVTHIQIFMHDILGHIVVGGDIVEKIEHLLLERAWRKGNPPTLLVEI